MTAPGPAPTQLLALGSHDDDSPRYCAVERAHLDRGAPKRAVALPDESSVIVAALILLNDSYPDTPKGDVERTKACGPYLSRLAGSRRSPDVEIRRDWLLADWPLREYGPLFFGELEETRAAAVALRALPEVVDRSTLDAALEIQFLAAQTARAALGVLDAQAGRLTRRSPASSHLAAGAAALAVRSALGALAARAARSTWSALALLAARAALAALDPKASPRQRAIAARAAANSVLSPLVKRLRASERALLDRMFACGCGAPLNLGDDNEADSRPRSTTW